MLPSDTLSGRQFANFRILQLLGRGGMAEVYLGRDVKLDRPVAVKVIDARYRDNPDYARRFVNEARALAAWSHPNIIQIYYADEEQGYFYYVMEFIHGMDLEEVLAEYSRRKELMPLEDVVHVGRAAAEALDAAHRKGVIHRDVKPSNLLISSEGRVILTDFGLAMNVDQRTLGTVFGSPHYISPEQAHNSSEAVPQSDLYSLGVILYEMLTGAVPFDDPSPISLALQHMTLPPPSPRQINPALSPAAEIVLLKALCKQPGGRYQTGRELVDDLEKAILSPAETAPFLAASSGTEDLGKGTKLRISRTSMLSIVARHLESQPPPAASINIQPPAPQSRRQTFWTVGCAVLLALGILSLAAIVLAFNLLGKPVQSARLPVTSTTASAVNALPTRTRIGLAPFPAPTATYTLIPSPSPTTTPLPTQAPTLTATPIPVGPAGDRFVMYYDDTSFYIQNLSGHERSVYPLAFERMGKKGEPKNRFEGWRWGNIYANFRDGYCMVLEILENDKQHLNPPECANRYLVIRTPTEAEEDIFWTKSKDSREFRVLWNDQEVGRCKISEKTCEVYLPAGE